MNQFQRVNSKRSNMFLLPEFFENAGENWRAKIIIYDVLAVEERLFVHRRVYRGTCNREREACTCPTGA